MDGEIIVGFSIIIPVFNVEMHLKECLDSILNQNYSDFEIILVDDGSSDSSSCICDEYSKKDQRISVIHKENGGPTTARKMGALAAKKEYVFCVDGDDYLPDNTLNTAAEFLQLGYDVLCFSYKTTDGVVFTQNIICGVYNSVDVFDRFLINEKECFPNEGDIFYTIWSKIVKRDLFINSQLCINDSLVLGEDIVLCAYIFSKASSVYFADYVGYIYRISQKSLSHNYNIMNARQHSIVCDELSKLYGDNSVKIRLFGLLCELRVHDGLIKNSNSFKEYKRSLAIVEPWLNNIRKYSGKTIVCNISFKIKIKTFLLKHNLYFLLFVATRVFAN